MGSERASAAEIEADWQATGLAPLTGRPGGPALTPVGAPATLARRLGHAIAALGGPQLDGAALLGARVGVLDLSRGGTHSAGGAARLLRCAGDGWVALSLPRAEDAELVPALVRDDRAAADPWAAVARWASTRPAPEVVARAAELGLAAGALGEWPAGAPAWTVARSTGSLPGRYAGRAADPTTEPRARPTGAPPAPRRVVNLGALWAAPLCAQLLHRAGCAVVDVESPARPDPSPAAWRAIVRAGHERASLDPTNPADRRALAELLTGADVVIEASRPRALRALGLDAARVNADGQPRTWVRITGHGPHSDRAAFGDDAAVAGGLVAADADGPVFAGDAIADPLTGLAAAMLVLAAPRDGAQRVIDVAMAGVAALAARAGQPPAPGPEPAGSASRPRSSRRSSLPVSL